MEGRYVNVIIPGIKRYMTLCEVEVFASLSVPDVVIPPPPPSPPPTVSLQLGGRNVTVVGERLCWSDALMYCRRYYWDLLSLHNQQEQSELEQLLSLVPFSLTDHVWLGLRRCAVISHIPSGQAFYFPCNSVKGRYVTVFLPGSAKVLSLCEVEVYYVPDVITTPPPPPTPPPPVSLQLGGRNVTVVGERLCWTDALMYCRRYYWDLLSLHSQQEQSELEQLLGLIPFSLTDHVWMGLRRSLRADEWFWMSGYSMNFLNWPQDFVPDSYSSTCGGVASMDNFLWQDQPCADNAVQRVHFYSTKDPTSP
nr:PREDICTED: uncharacterized protein LOC102199806 [Pundamilia nyererei]